MSKSQVESIREFVAVSRRAYGVGDLRLDGLLAEVIDEFGEPSVDQVKEVFDNAGSSDLGAAGLMTDAIVDIMKHVGSMQNMSDGESPDDFVIRVLRQSVFYVIGLLTIVHQASADKGSANTVNTANVLNTINRDDLMAFFSGPDGAMSGDHIMDRILKNNQGLRDLLHAISSNMVESWAGELANSHSSTHVVGSNDLTNLVMSALLLFVGVMYDISDTQSAVDLLDGIDLGDF